METFIQSLTSQAPGIAGVIIIVMFFLRAIAARDEIFVQQMESITERLAALEVTLAHHDALAQKDGLSRADTLERIERMLRNARIVPGKKNDDTRPRSTS